MKLSGSSACIGEEGLGPRASGLHRSGTTPFENAVAVEVHDHVNVLELEAETVLAR